LPRVVGVSEENQGRSTDFVEQIGLFLGKKIKENYTPANL
jgi:hypothetical protein